MHIFYTLIADFQIGNPGLNCCGISERQNANPTAASVVRFKVKDELNRLIVQLPENQRGCIQERLPAQPVDATPSDINLFTKGGVYDATKTGEAFRDAADRHVEPLEGGTVVASDWTRLRQKPCVDSLYVVAARRDCSDSASALAANAYTG